MVIKDVRMYEIQKTLMQLHSAKVDLPVWFFLAFLIPDHLVIIFLIHLTKIEGFPIYVCIFLSNK